MCRLPVKRTGERERMRCMRSSYRENSVNESLRRVTLLREIQAIPLLATADIAAWTSNDHHGQDPAFTAEVIEAINQSRA